MQNLYHINIKHNKSLYLEKSVSQDYLSKFFSYDKRNIKKRVFFYYNLIKLKNYSKKNQTKFFSLQRSETKKSSFLIIRLIKKKTFFC